MAAYVVIGRARDYRQFMLPYPADMVPHARLRPTWAAQVRFVRGLMLVVILCGLLLVVIALGVFLTQGSQIRVVADVLSERCQPRIDLPSAGTETRCDAAVRFTSVTGRVITTTVTDAFPSEFSGSGRSRTIDLRYDKNDRPSRSSRVITWPPGPSSVFWHSVLSRCYWVTGGLRALAGSLTGPYETGPLVYSRSARDGVEAGRKPVIGSA